MAKCLCQMSFHDISCQKKSLKDTVGCSMSKKSVSISQNHTQLGLFYHFLSLCTHFLRHFFIPANFTIVTVHYSSKIEDASTGPWV